MTAHQLLKINVEQLRTGMHVSNVFNERGTLLYSANTLIQTQEQIDALKRQGVITLTINLHKGSGSADGSRKADAEQHHEVYAPASDKAGELYTRDEIANAQAIREEAAGALQQVMFSVKTGRMFSIRTIVSSVESIVESMTSDPELMLNLCRLKTHSIETYNHAVNVAVMMIGFTSALGYSRDRIAAAGVGGLLHDIGLVSLPEGIFMRQGSYTRQERELFKKHPKNGYEIVTQQTSRFPPGVLEIVVQHHERINGGGYPAQLTGDQISELAQICAIADTYDTLTTQGIFNKKHLPQEALALIFQGADEDFSRPLVEHFTKLLGIYPVGSFVKIDTGEMGVVVKNNRQKLLSPIVRILFSSKGERLVTPYLKDLSVTDSRSDDQLARILHSLDPGSQKVEIEQFIIRRES